MRQSDEDGLTDRVDLGAARSRARAKRRQMVAVAVTVVVAAVVVAGAAVVRGREASAPGAPAPVDPVDRAQLGGLPLTPYWHDGVLHVRGVEIETPWRRPPMIDVAGEAVLAGLDWRRGVAPSWALVVGDRLEPLPIPNDPDAYPLLSLDGRIAYWWTYPTADSTRVVTWDTETNRELATRDLPGDDVFLAGIDADGMAYWVDEGSEIPVTRWDVRADTVQPMPDLRPSDVVTPRDERNWFQPQFVSPDGTLEVFDPDGPGDFSWRWLPHPVTRQLGVRPVGSEDPDDVVRLPIPESYTGELFTVWWETNETVLGLMYQSPMLSSAPRSYLVRCSIRGGDCALANELNDGSDPWSNWSFAYFPIAG